MRKLYKENLWRCNILSGIYSECVIGLDSRENVAGADPTILGKGGGLSVGISPYRRSARYTHNKILNILLWIVK